MKKSIVKLNFLAPLHVGNKNLNDSEYVIKVNTLFSALCLESNDISEFVDYVKNTSLKLSDCLPYIDETYYVPKPLMYVQHKSKNYKLFKKLNYIPVDVLEEFLGGDLCPEDEIEDFKLGYSGIRTQLHVGADPYQVGTYTFENNAGLYVIIEHEDDKIFELFEKLQYSGIGGKRSSGLGRFTYEIKECFEFPQGDKKILLNSAMAQDVELDSVLEGANYLLQKNSGFINQSRYKKKNFYTFVAGSTFNKEFKGDIFDVGNDEHPVYHYAIPMFMGVSI